MESPSLSSHFWILPLSLQVSANGGDEQRRVVRFREKKSEKRKVNKKREIRMRWWNEKRSRKEGRKEGSEG